MKRQVSAPTPNDAPKRSRECSTGKDQEKRRRKKKKKLQPLSQIQNSIVLKYDALESVLAFLNRRKVLAGIDIVCSTISSISKIDFNREALLSICSICPQLFHFEWVVKPAAGGVEDYQIYSNQSLEALTSKVADTLVMSFVGKLSKTKRRKIYINALRDGDGACIETIKLPEKPVDSNSGVSSTTFERQFKSNFAINLPNFAIDTEDGVLKYLKSQEYFYKNQIKNVKCYPAKSSQYGDLKVKLFPSLLHALEKIGIKRLYKHQAKGINAAIKDGSHVIISTPTSSGKSVVYNVPVLQEMIRDENATAIYMFPTKSLSHDQVSSLKHLSDAVMSFMGNLLSSRNKVEASGTGIEATSEEHNSFIMSFDGDSKKADRKVVKDRARIILTNPDMLHYTLLPQHDSYARVLRNCKYVVIDEAHVYKGAFGAHTTCVLRRFVRICLAYGSSPQFICCSATIGNPLQHFEELVPVNFLPQKIRLEGNSDDNRRERENAFSTINYEECRHTVSRSRNTCVITSVDDGSPRGERKFIMWNPPLFAVNSQSTSSDEENVSQDMARQPYQLPKNFHKMTARQKRDARLRMVRDQPERKSSIYETASLLALLVAAKVRTLAFVKVRKLTELVAKYTKDILLSNSHTARLANDVCSYRAGYLPGHRRQLEKRIFNQEMLGIASTNALELGIDIGNLDSVILLGFPGTISSLWQQSGRAGRKDRAATIIYVAFDSPIDQFFMSNPEKLLKRKVEDAVVEANNPYVLKMHLLCAARELALCNKEYASRAYDITSRTSSYTNDFMLFGGSENVMHLIQEHLESGNMVRVSPSLFGIHPSIDLPSRGVNIRSIDNVTITVLHSETRMPIDTIEQFRSYWEVHPGAIYMNQGTQFTIIKLDLDQHIAIAKPSNVKYFTSCRDHTDVNAMDRLTRSPANSTNAYYGRVSICTSVWGYRKQWVSTGNIFETVPLTLPPIEYSSFGVWVDIPSVVVNLIESNGCDFLGSIHGANHVLLHCLPLFVSCDRTDCGTECPSIFQERARPLRLVLYDAHPGGIGVCKRVLPIFSELVQFGYDLICSCKCKTGCPSCVLDVGCKEYNDVIDKNGARLILKVVMEQLKSASND